MSDSDCDAKGIPAHLHREERPADPVFDAAEPLYRRFRLGTPDLTAAISFARMSVNRGKYCESPDDVLWNDEEGGRYEGFGVLSLPVKALQRREKLPHEDSHFTLKPEHDPTRCNYPHTEVVATKVSSAGDEEELPEIRPKSVKLALRKALRDAISVAFPARPD
jgi:hypothetical protein